MKYLIGLPCVNRTDLLARAVDSIPRPMRSRLVILDNSGASKKSHSHCHVIPPVPLTASQSLNFFRRIAVENDHEIMFFMHNDAQAGEDTFEKLLDLADPRRGKWGCIFTHYDALAAFNVAALKEVGEWDTNLPQYFTDNDYFRRMRLAGWHTEESNLPVVHTGSQTRMSDPEINFLNSITFPLYAKYYSLKWGGSPNRETFTKPWDGKMV